MVVKVFYLSSRRSREVYFFSLFVLQGLVPGFAVMALFNYFAAHGLSAQTLSFYFAFIASPWCLQIFAAPLVDRFDQFAVGKRRAWILFSAVGTNVSLLLLLRVTDPLGEVNAIAWAFFANGIFSALLNVACDALIVDQTPESESAATGAFARSGLSVATALSGALFASLLPQVGFHLCVWILIAMNLAVSCAISFTRECSNDKLVCWKRKKHARETSKNWKAILKRSLESSQRPVVIKWFVLTFIVSLAFAILRLVFVTSVLSRHLLSDTDLSQGEAVLYLAIGTLGAAFSNVVVKRYGESRAVIGALLLTAVLSIGLSALDGATASWQVWPVLTLICLAPTLLFVAYLPSLMSLSRGEVAATQFAAFMVVMNLGETGGATLFGAVSALRDHAYLSLAIPFAASALFYIRYFWALDADYELDSAYMDMPEQMKVGGV